MSFANMVYASPLSRHVSDVIELRADEKVGGIAA